MLLFSLKTLVHCLNSLHNQPFHHLSLITYFHCLKGLREFSLWLILLVWWSDWLDIMTNWWACRGDIREISEDHFSALHGGPGLTRWALISSTVWDFAKFLSAWLCFTYFRRNNLATCVWDSTSSQSSFIMEARSSCNWFDNSIWSTFLLILHNWFHKYDISKILI